MKDDALLELASTRPTNHEELGRSRLLLREGRKPDIADGIIAAVKAGMETKPEDLPRPDSVRDQLQVNPALADLLRTQGWGKCGLWPDDIEWDRVSRRDEADWRAACMAFGLPCRPLAEQAVASR
jgi:hypothetical protein